MTAVTGRRVRRRDCRKPLFLFLISSIILFQPAVSIATERIPGDTDISLSAGAYYWFNLNRNSGKFNFGIDGLENTYFWHVNSDIEHHLNQNSSLGFHAEFRFRETDKFRAFFEDKTWFHELYGFADTRYGRFRAGKMWSRFGLDWDGSWWGNVPYFDGFKLDPDWGVAWEYHREIKSNLSLALHTQFFFAEDQVNGSIVGADPESSDLYEDEHSFFLRAVPRREFTEHSALEVGVSLRIGTVKSSLGGEETVDSEAVDITYAWRDLKLYAEYMRHAGTLHETHYVTGGSSDRIDSVLAGLHYTLHPARFIGPVTLRHSYSRGKYKNPGGRQELFLYGLTANLNKWLTFYFEYVDWDVKPAGAPRISFEEGFQFILYWNLSYASQF